MAESDFGKVSNGRTHAMTAKQTKKSPSKSSPPAVHASQPKNESRRQEEVPVRRFFTQPGLDPLEQVLYERRSSTISNPDGSVVFKMEGAEVPVGWSQLATDIVISKYFRKAGIQKMPAALARPDGAPEAGERSVRQVVYRVANTIRQAADSFGGYFATKEAADTFEAELSYLLVHQYGAFNSPVWFNCGLYHQYGIEGSGGNWAWDPASGDSDLAADGTSTSTVVETENAYGRPQCSACFIQSVQDDLMGIYELVKSEARLFKYGSGTGTNFSAIRGKQEKLSGGGTSSGLMSFLEVFDRAAGATKSGGTTRRAAKMVCLDVDHPEIVDFVEWKMREEKKAHALIRAGYSNDFNGDAYHTISGQNSNNSVRVTDEFMKAVLAGGKWHTRMRLTGEVCETFEAKDLWRKIAEAAWGCADPGLQYDSTVNRWHTCSNTSRINASNPCSEYMFLDDSACNLASVNLIKFLRDDGSFDVEGYRHACRIFFIAQEVLVDLSSYPTKRIAQNSHDYRPLGLGYANLGSLLMILGVPYDSDQGRAIAGALTAIMCGHAYKTSAEMAKSKSPFVGYAKNREPMLRVMNMHRDAAYAISRDDCWLPGESKDAGVGALYRAACEDWDDAVHFGELHGYRNAQSTVLAPTGTIGLLMDCDTTGIEPDFALVKFKKLAGGGYFKIVNQSVPAALSRLGYSATEVQEIVAYVSGTNTLLAAPVINRRTLKEKGFTDEDLAKVEAALPGVFDLDSAFASWVLGEAAHTRLLNGVTGSLLEKRSLLEKLGFTKVQIAEAGDVIIGRMTIEGAPHLKVEHYPVFDCANRCGKIGQRYLAPMSHVKMMAATQPFLSGAISKTVNLPNEATIDDVAKLYEEGWRLGLKAVALYRDGCKASQPLSSSGESKSDAKETPAKEGLAASSVERLEPVPTTAEQSPQLSLALTPKGTREYGMRIRLPKKRRGFTQEARVGGHKIFLRTGEYEDGRLGEIFIDMHKEGAAFRSLMNCFAMSVSVGLQYGVPLQTYVDQFTFTRFEPQGVVEGHPNVKIATSIVDYLFRVLGVEYLNRYDLAHVKPEESNPTLTAGDSRPVSGEQRPAPELGYTKDFGYTKEATARSAAMSETLEGRGEPSAGSHDGAATQGNANVAGGVLSAHLDAMMGDAPVCDVCGHITVRNGACYKCLNCGNSMGCS
ncbi:vitamin B12-dependent ribonucleotide reductase [Pendulispora rubella]|uniref:Vitamin B12-dependent ribonucleotide reductase n=1 Tax=Pendulispora rubella TaxID=2741070 RepID=A0ABZ2LEY2_9BACT